MLKCREKEWNVDNVHKTRELELGYDTADELRVQEVEVQLCLSASVAER